MLNGVVQIVTLAHDSVHVFNMTALFGDNQLTVDFLNKQPNDTLLDSNNKITHDLAVELIDFQVDAIDATSNIMQHLVYTTHDQENVSTYGYMHRNGRITLNFQCPIFYFLRNMALVK
jgi:hypothetical protein